MDCARWYQFSIRFTPHPKGLDDISGYSFDYLDKFEKYIVAREDKDKKGQSVPVHYHIFIDTTYGEATVRQKTKEALRLPAGGRGKNNGYYSLIPDWKDPGYICKYNEILGSKGYTEKELMDYVISGKKTYLNKVEGKIQEVKISGPSTSAKSPRISYQQLIISIAYAEWENYKKQCRQEGTEPDLDPIIEMVCKAMRETSRGINAYLLQDIVNAILFDDIEYRQRILQRLKSKIIL